MRGKRSQDQHMIVRKFPCVGMFEEIARFCQLRDIVSENRNKASMNVAPTTFASIVTIPFDDSTKL